MSFWEEILEALNNLFSSKLRSLLALLGILIGTASVVAMVSGGQLATIQALKQFKQLGTNLLSINLSYTGNNASPDNPLSQVPLDIAIGIQNSSKNIMSVAPYINAYADTSYNGNSINASIIGTTDDLTDILKLTFSKGRFISLMDRYNFYCTIGSDIYDQIKSYNPNPIGTQLRIGNQFFTIVGLLKEAAQTPFFYADPNSTVFIPIQTTMILSKYSTINNIILKTTPIADPEILSQQITDYLSRYLPQQKPYINNAKQILDSMAKQKQILTIFLGFIGSISLLVGGIGVMNIMLVSVIERRREIGIRLAIGAKRRDIQILFLTESILLSLIGGILGVILGILVSFVIAEARHWQFIIFLDPPLVGFSVSVIIGIISGFYPAYKASKLDPIETLRSE